MLLDIDETRIEKLLRETPKQSYGIQARNMPLLAEAESPIFPSNSGSTVQSSPLMSPEESKSRLLFFRDRIIQSGTRLLDEDQLQSQIDEIKGRV
jgi:hypothetical protein